MKRSLILCMAVLLLAGCSGLPKPSVTPAPTKAVAVNAPQTTGSTASPAVTLADARTPPATIPLPEVEYYVGYVVDTNKENGARCSYMAVTDGVYVYYREDFLADDDPNDGAFYHYQKIMRFDSSTGETKTLRNLKGKGFLNELLLGKDNTLYYVMSEDNCWAKPFILYEYRPGGKDLPLVSDICSDVYMENDCLYYYSGDEYTCATWALVSFNPSTGQITPRNESTSFDGHNMPEDKRYDIRVVSRGTVTDILVLDYESHKEMELHIYERLDIDYAFVYKEYLYAVFCNQDRYKSDIYKIKLSDGSVVSKTPVDGEIGGNVFYNGKLYCYTSKQEKDEEGFLIVTEEGGIAVIDEKIGVYDPLTGEYALIKEMEEKSIVYRDVYWFAMEAGCGYLWTFWYEEAEGGCYEYRGKVKIP